MLKFVTVCGAGVGSSMMLRLFSQEILNKENIEAIVDASDISSVNVDDYDVVITTSDFADRLRTEDARILRIDNMMDKENLKKEILNAIKDIGE